MASAAVGSGFNYASTRSVGKIAKSHFRNRGKFTAELQKLVSRQNTYELIFPAAALYVPHLDGKVSPKERELYRAMLSRMSFEEHTQEEFQQLMEDEDTLIEAVARTEDIETRRSLLDVLVLMAVCDGELAEEERNFLREISGGWEYP